MLRRMNSKRHPPSCKDPNCKLSYVEHLKGFGGNTTPKRPRKRTLRGLDGT